MKGVALCAALLAFMAAAAAAQDGRKPDDIVQLKADVYLVGRIVKVEDDAIEMQVRDEKEPRRIPFSDIVPYNVYRIKLDRIDKSSGQARFDLAEFCLAHGIYSMAVREFEEAARCDKSLEERALKKREEAHNEDARAKFEDAKKLRADRRYDEASKILRMLIERYDDTPYFEEARKESAKIAEEVKKDIEDKKAQLEEKKVKEAEAKAKIKEDIDKGVMEKAVALIDDAQKAWADGLDQEARNLTRAERAWKQAELSLLSAKRHVELLLRSNDVDVLKKAKELDRDADQWLAKTYYRLGRMWAVEGNYTSAHDWLNKALRVPHDDQIDHLVNEILLTLSQLEMRRRAARGGY